MALDGTAGPGDGPQVTLQFGDGRDDVLALGLPPGRLAVFGCALSLAAAALRLPLPEGLRLAIGGSALALGSLLSWGSVLGVPLTRWAGRFLALAVRGLAGAGDQGPGWSSVDTEADKEAT